MLVSNELNKVVQELDRQRFVLQEKRKKTILWYLLGPALVAIISAVNWPTALFQLTLGASIASYISYMINIGSPFLKVASNLKKTILQDIMEVLYPDVVYTYSKTKRNLKEIADNTGMFVATEFREEDVIKGKYKTSDFYFSEVHLLKKSGDSKTTVFKGLLIKLKIPGKQFPNSRIESRAGTPKYKNLIEKIRVNEEYAFYYDTDNQAQFKESLSHLFPFIEHLTMSNDDVRIKTQGDEIVLFLKSGMKFLDAPTPKINETLANKLYVERIAKQLNTLFFIIETLSNTLDSEEIEERLKLRVVEYAKKLNEE